MFVFLPTCTRDGSGKIGLDLFLGFQSGASDLTREQENSVTEEKSTRYLKTASSCQKFQLL